MDIYRSDFMMGGMKTFAAVLTAGLWMLAAHTSVAETTLGDAGHYLVHRPKMFLLNPDGRAFTVTIHSMRWVAPESWNVPAVKTKLTGPDGKVVFDDKATTITAPAGAKGVYTLETEGAQVWVESSLDQSVVWTGETEGNAFDNRRFITQPIVPRRWWFWVPAGTTKFTCKSQRADRYMSQREEGGVFIITPRGQRIRALWGFPPNTEPYRQELVTEVEVEPGAGGRFWAVEMRLGDSHNYSKPNFCLDGVPPYLARSPEEWFDPTTGARPVISPYDETQFIQSARSEPDAWPTLQHFSPCPSLGDPDGVTVLGDARFAIANPEGRPLRFRIGTYLPRTTNEAARVRVTGAIQFEKTLPLLHLHHKSGQPTDTLTGGKGISYFDVTGGERWMAFTYPATPLVLVGEVTAGGAHRFRFTAGTVRNWYFRVPPGTKEFTVRAVADGIMNLEINAPDRTMAVIYDTTGERVVAVPPGLDGKIWHLRPDVASAARFAEAGRYQELNLTIDLQGVPGYLSPTWEQWFDPASK